MFNQVVENAINTIKEIEDFNPSTVIRGEPGKVNTIKDTGCLIMSDFQPPRSFGDNDGELVKKIPFTINCFVITGQRKTYKDCESDCLDLAHKVLTKMSVAEAIVEMDGNYKYYKYEWTDIEWVERSASMCTIAIEFSLFLQV